jgi:hypothetical protein
MRKEVGYDDDLDKEERGSVPDDKQEICAK